MKPVTLAFLALVLTLYAAPSRAVLPESGLYWNSDHSGLGYYIEVQGTTLVMLAYAHDKETGAPLFYLASGEVKPAPDVGELAYKFEGPLYRFNFGPCIICSWSNWDTSEHAQQAGSVTLYFYAHNHVAMLVTTDNGPTKHERLKRFKFARPVYNLPTIATDQLVDRYFSDLRGEWVFVDKEATDGQVWRFKFSEGEYSASSFSGRILGIDLSSTDNVVFRDEPRDTNLVCVSYGCGLIQDGVTLASFPYTDVAPDSMFGYITPTDPDAEYETGHHVIGVRVPDLTPEIPAPETAQ